MLESFVPSSNNISTRLLKEMCVLKVLGILENVSATSRLDRAVPIFWTARSAWKYHVVTSKHSCISPGYCQITYIIKTLSSYATTTINCNYLNITIELTQHPLNEFLCYIYLSALYIWYFCTMHTTLFNLAHFKLWPMTIKTRPQILWFI